MDLKELSICHYCFPTKMIFNTSFWQEINWIGGIKILGYRILKMSMIVKEIKKRYK